VAYFPLAFPPTTYMRSSFPHSCYMPHPSHPAQLHYSNYTWRRVQIISFLLCRFLYSLVTSSLLGPNIILSTLFSNILSLCSITALHFCAPFALASSVVCGYCSHMLGAICNWFTLPIDTLHEVLYCQTSVGYWELPAISLRNCNKGAVPFV
jgi:hypothetical protein